MRAVVRLGMGTTRGGELRIEDNMLYIQWLLSEDSPDGEARLATFVQTEIQH